MSSPFPKCLRPPQGPADHSSPGPPLGPTTRDTAATTLQACGPGPFMVVSVLRTLPHPPSSWRPATSRPWKAGHTCLQPDTGIRGRHLGGLGPSGPLKAWEANARSQEVVPRRCRVPECGWVRAAHSKVTSAVSVAKPEFTSYCVSLKTSFPTSSLPPPQCLGRPVVKGLGRSGDHSEVLLKASRWAPSGSRPSGAFITPSTRATRGGGGERCVLCQTGGPGAEF